MSHDISKPTDIEIPKDSLWAKLPIIGGVLGLLGIGATLAMASSHEGRAMFSYLWAFTVVLSLGLGALGWILIDHTVRAGWSAVVRRIAENIAGTLPLLVLLWIPIGTIGMHALYPWTHKLPEPDAILESKRWFLTEGFFLGRAVFYAVVWVLLAYFLRKWSVAQDTAATKEERDALTRKMWKLSAAGIFLWGLTQSFAAVDWLMSLQPHWYSTIFGVYFFAGSILAFFAFMILTSMGLQKAGVLKTAINTEHFHDLGKYMFGFTVFWAYIAFSQFMLIWYAAIPEEIEFYLVRLEGGWQYVSYALPVLHFFVPFFFLLSRHIKRNRTLLAVGAIWTLVLHLVDLYWLILPNFGTHGEGEHHPHLALTLSDATALLGMVGIFLAFFAWRLNSSKVVCINDPRLPEALAHENF